MPAANSDAVLKACVDAYRTHKNQRATAAALKLRQSTISDRLNRAAAKGFITVEELHPAGPANKLPKLEGDAVSRRIVTLTDENKRLNKALRDAHREANTEELLRELIGSVVDTPVEPPDWTFKPKQRERHKATPEVPVTILSDWHVGEVVQKLEVNGMNEFNLAIAEERANRYFDKLIELPRDFHTGVYPGIVVNFGGDTVSGGLHEELRKTDEDDVIPCVLKARDWIAEGLRRLADHYGRVYVPGCCGNHGRLTIRPEFKKYYKKNWDYLIFKLLAAHFQDDKRVVFDMRPSNDVYYRVFNERYLLCHGDMLGVKGGDGIIGSIGPIMRGEVKISGQSSAMNRPIDKLIIGHWHQRLWLPRTIVNNALKGFDEFAMKALGAKPDRPTQALFYVHPVIGMTAHWDIYTTKIKPMAATEWVSWQA